MERNTLVLALIIAIAAGLILLVGPGIAKFTQVKTYYVPGYATSNPAYVISYSNSPSSSSGGSSSSSSSSSSTSGSVGTSAYFDNDWFWNGNYLYANPNATAVGIGTQTPQYKLDVYGDIRAYAASVLADYFVLTYRGEPTGWRIEYNPVENALEIAYVSPSGTAYNNLRIVLNTSTGKLILETNGGDVNATGGTVYANSFVITGSLGWKINYTESNKALTFWYWNGKRWVRKMVISPRENIVNASSLVFIVKNITAPVINVRVVKTEVVQTDKIITNETIVNTTKVVFVNITTTNAKIVNANITILRTNVTYSNITQTQSIVSKTGIVNILKGETLTYNNVTATYVKTSNLQVGGSTVLGGQVTINGAQLEIINLPEKSNAEYVLAYDSSTGSVYYVPVSSLNNGWIQTSSGVVYTMDSVGIRTASPQATLDVDGTLRVTGPNGRFDVLYFGIYNDFAFSGLALIIHPAWTQYTPSALLYISGDLSNFRIGIATDKPKATLDVNGTFRVTGPSGRYFRLFFGALNDFEYNGSALVVHPAWGSSGYNPSAVLYLSDSVNDFKVGIGTDNPQYKLDVAGDIRAVGSAVLADYFRFTEAGNPTNFEFDYFPNTPLGNGVGLAYYNGTVWKPVMLVTGSGYVIAPRFYISEEGNELTPE